MNKDQVKGEMKEVAGKVQEKAGQVIGSTDQQIRGSPNRRKARRRRPSAT
jgi:uncharacterized protein YjbJ (UPF0337 family)